MNKMELVELMATTAKLAKSTCKSVLDAFITSVENSMKKDKTVVITGFGTFSTLKRKARTGVNPAQGRKCRFQRRESLALSQERNLRI